MNLFFTMNPNDNDEERHPNAFEVDDETDVYFLSQAYEYQEHLQQEENRPRLTRNPIHRDREGAEERLMAGYFDDYFRPDATGRMSLSVIMKCTVAILQLAYCNTPDAFDEYLQMTGANNDLWIRHPSLFGDLLDDKAPVAPFVVNGVGFEKGYYLADVIYPQWATFVKSSTVANDAKHSYFKKSKESARKDVERAFGVLQGQDQQMAATDWNDVYANPSRNVQRTWVERCEVQRRKAKELRDRETHISLQQNLMEHIWREVEDF
ncbi:ALP1-like protein isoform X1 [Tanacetum coccineum]